MEWTTDWPTIPGWYWFYGDPYAKASNKATIKVELYPVKVVKIANGVSYISNGSFVYKREAAEGGLWQPMQLPELPGG